MSDSIDDSLKEKEVKIFNLYCVLPFSNMDGWLRQLLNISTLLFFFGVMSVLVCSIVFFPLFEISQPS
jgi:hypothetical protein